MSGGNISRVAKPITIFHCEILFPMYLKSPEVTGRIASSVIRDSAIKRSPQAARKVKIATVSTAGTDKGKMINRKALKAEQPSIRAASESSLGTERKKGRSIVVAKGRQIAASAKIKPGQVLTNPIPLK